MVRPKSFRRNVFQTVLLVALIPAVTSLVAATLLLRGLGTGAGTLGPWDSVAESGRALVDRSLSLAPDDPELQRLAREHQAALSASVTQSRRYSIVADGVVRILPWAALVGTLFLVGVSSLAARRVSKRLGGPMGELVEWTELIAAGQPLPPVEKVRRPIKEFRVLRRALRNMTGELERARIREVEAARVRAWSDMARRVAHEIKNPLTPIRMGAAALARNPDPGIQDTGEMILEEVTRLDLMARDFSRFGRPPEGPPAPVDVAELLTALARQHGGTAQDREAAEGAEGTRGAGGPTVSVQVEDGLPLVVGHHDALFRAVLNLLVNAQEALEGHEGGRVELGARAVEGGVEIRVTDNGPGIPPELGEEIWLPEVTTRRRGSGLGLAMVRQTVQAHGGEARVVTAPGAGADFRLLLPVRDGGE